jgi:CubicO group peptidase (beta-lactamase class C family)
MSLVRPATHHGVAAALRSTHFWDFLATIALAAIVGASHLHTEGSRMPRTLLAAALLLALLTPSSFLHGQERKIAVSGTPNPDLAPLDDMMLAFLKDNQVPGAALAVAKDGRLVYARGFGDADPQLGLPVQPKTRFRIASISKPITAAAILKLIEMGKLRKDDNPFDLLQITLPDDADPRLGKITIQQMLQHTAGWDREKSFDPMFRPLLIAKTLKVSAPPQTLDIIRYMTTQKLDHDPGTRYAYSNFGYCVLGRVIEKASGLSYEAFVQKHIFDPIDIHDTQLGSTLKQAKNEAKYIDEKNRTGKAVIGPQLGQSVPLPYGTWHLEAMDSHGGWISTAPDLVRFGSQFLTPKKCKILAPDSVQAMFAPPDGPVALDKDGKAKSTYYGLGWQVRKVDAKGGFNAWHNGALDGTATLLVRRADGLCWAVLFNTRSNAKGEYLGRAIDPLVHQAVNQIQRWPSKNFTE